ncbi:MAG: 1-acyl-sn-glycerol-3-phosphate acyltransferase [Acidobacteriota bacterium]|nr:MAG: 1-acyl-sn-glycerol-3-phosphate acyltransferase [Acidobacteriota bacterium]
MPPETNNSDAFEAPSPALVASLRFVGWVIGKVAWRISHKNVGCIPEDDGRGLLIAANHQTYLDPYWICLPVHREPLRFMAWDRAFEWFFVGPFIRKLGAYPVNIEKGSVASMKASLKALERGSTVVVFPEGARCFGNGEMLEFKQGAARLAIQANVPVLPVTIIGGNRIWPRGTAFPRPGKVEIVYHPPIETEGFLPEDVDRERAEALNSKLREVIASAL